MTYTVSVPATFSFDVHADTPEEALAEARRLLSSDKGVMDDYNSFRLGFDAAWVHSLGNEPVITDTYE